VNYKLKVSEYNGLWAWSIENYVGDSVAESGNDFANELEARKDGRIAISDWNEE
jgi:hypothetical protein